MFCAFSYAETNVEFKHVCLRKWVGMSMKMVTTINLHRLSKCRRNLLCNRLRTQQIPVAASDLTRTKKEIKWICVLVKWLG